ncbi:hypothetical protein V6N12_070465 [Hibiscus sabdariffa]|uniref:Uncharacterized protein n=1 Tax=Hibiscus sabdariffa TaxID=183260 RepID=A0ABR2FGW6_9ROSI
MHKDNSASDNPIGDLIGGTGGRPSESLANIGALPASYAAVAAKKSGHKVNGSLGFGFDLDMDTVEVFDEDCLVSENGAFPTIKFSNRVHDQIDHSMHVGRGGMMLDGDLEKPAEVMGPSDKDPNVPCMITADRRRPPQKQSMATGSNKETRESARSRFAVLDTHDPIIEVAVEPQELVAAQVPRAGHGSGPSKGSKANGSKGNMTGKAVSDRVVDSLHGNHAAVAKNTSYLASYTDRKAKKASNALAMSDKAATVPMDENVGVKIFEHVFRKGTWGHKTFSLVEPSFEGNVRPHHNRHLSREAPTAGTQQRTDSLNLTGTVPSPHSSLDPLPRILKTSEMISSDGSDTEDGIDHMEDSLVHDTLA